MRFAASIMLSSAVLAAPGTSQVAPGEDPLWVSEAVEAPRVTHRTFMSAAVGGPVSYHVFTPDEYDADEARRFPVLYWLHGSETAPGPAAQLPAYLAAGMRDGRIPPMIVVIPNGLWRSFWVDSKDGRVPLETVIITELIPHVDANYRSVSSRDGRILEGFSLGGYGAARFAFKYPELFSAVSILSGGPFNPDLALGPRAPEALRQRALDYVFGADIQYFAAQSPWTLVSPFAEAPQRTRIRVVVGGDDALLEDTRAFHEHLNALGVEHEYVEVDGIGHDTRPLMNALGDRYWAFFAPGL